MLTERRVCAMREHKEGGEREFGCFVLVVGVVLVFFFRVVVVVGFANCVRTKNSFVCRITRGPS